MMTEEKMIRLFRETQNGKVTVRVPESKVEELLKDRAYSRFVEPTRPQIAETPRSKTPQKEGGE
ncbi:hypothetical protein [Leptospira santarosai]|nr:hypothetical protein [Leptospira santarosai]